MENEAIEMTSEAMEEAPEIIVAAVGNDNNGLIKGVFAGSLATLGCVAVCELFTKLVIPKIRQKKKFTVLDTKDSDEDFEDFD